MSSYSKFAARQSANLFLLIAESMIKDDENITAIKVYYNTDNARLYHSNDIQFFDIDPSVSLMTKQ